MVAANAFDRGKWRAENAPRRDRDSRLFTWRLVISTFVGFNIPIASRRLSSERTLRVTGAEKLGVLLTASLCGKLVPARCHFVFGGKSLDMSKWDWCQQTHLAHL